MPDSLINPNNVGAVGGSGAFLLILVREVINAIQTRNGKNGSKPAEAPITYRDATENFVSVGLCKKAHKDAETLAEERYKNLLGAVKDLKDEFRGHKSQPTQ